MPQMGAKRFLKANLDKEDPSLCLNDLMQPPSKKQLARKNILEE